jgi:hypothetical protein
MLISSPLVIKQIKKFSELKVPKIYGFPLLSIELPGRSFTFASKSNGGR